MSWLSHPVRWNFCQKYQLQSAWQWWRLMIMIAVYLTRGMHTSVCVCVCVWPLRFVWRVHTKLPSTIDSSQGVASNRVVIFLKQCCPSSLLNGLLIFKRAPNIFPLQTFYSPVAISVVCFWNVIVKRWVKLSEVHTVLCRNTIPLNVTGKYIFPINATQGLSEGDWSPS